MVEQIPLAFEHRLRPSFNSFYPGKNQEAINHLIQCVSFEGEQQLFIWGSSGLGKTHLLQACCMLAEEQKKTAFYYEFIHPDLPDAGLLNGLEDYEVVCFDNIDAIAGHAEWEQQFFNFYNRHRDNGFRLILSSTCPPNWLTIELPDLKTRLNWGLTLKLQALTDEEIILALSFRAKQLGFDLSPQVGRFLFNRYARDTVTLWQLLTELDHATLAAKRKLTLPFLKQILGKHEPP
ncbi:MAG: DnaA regulatory inactivator Hda [Methylicorpusculum sp.]|uniref:DnaA regulatory inactivator Hda n=1 Tax=Methylicorpusculum sp. TaxID=2713644 RepID=UPI002719757C|nr:DnaA regulatory inactivator Hda [Methylicorpusculum sp.]MDO8940545.1 DnaA regulatory inactivator Hda [Methylicorpusculum sp.]MDO9241636.1 DnaA regulatory inactivator Hda [Methylicorpusculum sp.]MDP2204449.1 DnaA regulatory inactivator Hda [Methylicorpusculum sp.]